MQNPSDIELWNSSAGAWISHLSTRGDISRRFMDPRVWRVLGDVQGKTVLDIGCGEGRFSRQLTDRGAITTGLDPTPNLLKRAHELGGGATFVDAFADNLPFAGETFDVVLFYLVLIDIEPLEPAIHEAFRVLKPGGKCIIVNLTSMNTASNRLWELDVDGNRIGWHLDNYAESRQITSEWSGIKINNYHRPLSTYLQTFLATGFTLKSFDEAIPTDEEIAETPELAAQRICPYFNLQVWIK